MNYLVLTAGLCLALDLQKQISLTQISAESQPATCSDCPDSLQNIPPCGFGSLNCCQWSDLTSDPHTIMGCIENLQAPSLDYLELVDSVEYNQRPYNLINLHNNNNDSDRLPTTCNLNIGCNDCQYIKSCFPDTTLEFEHLCCSAPDSIQGCIA